MLADFVDVVAVSTARHVSISLLVGSRLVRPLIEDYIEPRMALVPRIDGFDKALVSLWTQVFLGNGYGRLQAITRHLFD